MISILEAQILRILSLASLISSDRHTQRFDDDEQKEKTIQSLIREAHAKILENKVQKMSIGLFAQQQHATLSDDIFLYCAETAFKCRSYEIARSCLDAFFSTNPEQASEQFIRAQFCKAQIIQEQSTTLKGDELVESVNRALQCVLRAMNVALQFKTRYAYLVHEASVHYWNISMLLFHDNCRKHLLPTIPTVVQALQDINDADLGWRISYNVNLALCYDEVEQVDAAAKALNTANELMQQALKTNPNFEHKSLQDNIFRAQIHMGRRGLKKVQSSGTTSGNAYQKCLTIIQLVKRYDDHVF
jgi:tetratricopeptide (TPR) repeat protein